MRSNSTNLTNPDDLQDRVVLAEWGSSIVIEEANISEVEKQVGVCCRGKITDVTCSVYECGSLKSDSVSLHASFKDVK